MEGDVSSIRRELAVPAHAVRRTPRERRNGERREFEADLGRRRRRGEKAAERAPGEDAPRRPRELGDSHVDVTA